MTANLLVGVAGLPGSGKTTLAMALAPQLRASLLSFGDFFRHIGAGADLQTFGREYVIKNKPADVVDEFLAFYAAIPLSRCVIEGIRHVAIWRALQKRAESARLVFIDIEKPALLNRLMARSAIDLNDARRRLDHAVESEVMDLRNAAEIVLKQHSRALAVAAVMDELAKLR